MENSKNKFSNWLKNSITARMMVVGFLLLILLIPLEFVKELIRERAVRQAEVVSEINGKWGNNVLISGPIIKIPYKVLKEETNFNEKDKTYYPTTSEIIKYAYFFPDSLKIDSDVDANTRERSIYESVVFTASIAMKGTFPKIDFSALDILPENIVWEKATVLIKTSNLRGIKTTPSVRINSLDLAMTPQYSRDFLNTIQSGFIENAQELFLNENKFSFNLKINGSESLRFLPIGKETDVSMRSNWNSPSFDGNFLPEDTDNTIKKEGFTAQWRILQINRQFEQQFSEKLPDLKEFSFGTKFIVPVDDYQKSERTAKYGFMVIGLTLLVFLLIQLVSHIYIHPFQYVMIGLALVMFYTLLISISEHSDFFMAYMVAAAAVLALITIYSRAILNGWKFPMLICASLASLYGFIYVIIQLENYALLVGSIGLFVILGIIMFASRKIDWNNG
ncbi:cell envelope integrity protein CreD [Aequorivita echinoideorum]|uniref:Cell envelope integrity protein CreD n=1 Tax=Aequorivita echinoideorum TaxID=1549647 RepID=A0ABS5S6I5_9FLAO|nr:cell envelope integrity protein CreD [Aequorivita echinoideorum]MBT0608825.1 cell envelope integrity protein CreD [Aequorivita echinoideorum]